jgi:hypothetical protein
MGKVDIIHFLAGLLSSDLESLDPVMVILSQKERCIKIQTLTDVEYQPTASMTAVGHLPAPKLKWE